MRSRSRAWIRLVGKEWRELLASRAWWVMLVLIGPLVGVSFIGAVRIYAEASGLGGTSAGVGEAFSPLDGIWVPTFVAYEIAATFLLPFVAIRLVAGDRQSGALKLELQQPMSPLSRIAAKALVLFARMVSGRRPGTPGAGILWKLYGGHAVRAGARERRARPPAERRTRRSRWRPRPHRSPKTRRPQPFSRSPLPSAPGSSVSSPPCTADCGSGSPGSRPGAMLDRFQHGLIQLGTALVALTFMATGLGVAALWMRLGVSVQRRAFESAGVVAAAAALVVACTFVRLSWDVSENRRNSFPEADEEALENDHRLRSASRRTWRPKIRAAPISNTRPSRSFDG